MTNTTTLTHIYAAIDSLLKSGRFDLLNNLLKIEASKKDVDVILTLLIGTAPEKSSLSNRDVLLTNMRYLYKDDKDCAGLFYGLD